MRDDAREQEIDALMERLCDGDRAAFDPLFRALWPRAVRVARARLDPSDADDAAQSALARVFARADEFERGRPVLPWFYAIVANETHTVARRRAKERARAQPLADDATAGATSPEDEAADAETRRALASSIARLDATSAQAIERSLGLAAPAEKGPAARKRTSRAYAKLRRILGGFFE